MKKELALALLFFLVFSFHVANAQGSAKLWSGVYSVIFIVVFILILLIVGGVIHFPRTRGNMGKWITIAIFAIMIFVLPYFIYNYLSSYFPTYTKVPDSFKKAPLPSYASRALEMLGLPKEWMYVPAIIYLFIIPFAGIYTIVWAFLKSLNIFENRVNRILALLITFLSIPVGWFVRLTWLLFAGMGIWSVAVFAATFIVGIFFRGMGVVSKQYLTYRKISDIRIARLKDLSKALEGLRNADLNTIQQTIPPLLQRYSDVIPMNVTSLLSSATQAKKPEDARAAINQAIAELKKIT